MPLLNLQRAVAVTAVALVTGACAGGSAGGARTATSTPSSADAAEFEAIYQARQDSARMRYTEADVRFMTHMIHHHAQALEMSALAPERTDNEQIRTLAARITNAQSDEIAIMRRWLEDRGLPVPAMPDAAHDHAAMVHGEMHHGGEPEQPMQMPGMLTPAEMQRLAATRGAEFDRGDGQRDARRGGLRADRVVRPSGGWRRRPSRRSPPTVKR